MEQQPVFAHQLPQLLTEVYVASIAQARGNSHAIESSINGAADYTFMAQVNLANHASLPLVKVTPESQIEVLSPLLDAYPLPTVVFLLAHNDAVKGWSDADQRGLVRIALDKELELMRFIVDRQATAPERVTELQEDIAKLEDIKNRLIEEVTPISFGVER